MGGMIMKQFSLEEYLKNPSLKVITRDGRNARIICTDMRSEFPIVAIIGKEDRDERVDIFTKDGRYYQSTKNSNSFLDLFFSETKEHFDPHTLKPFDRVLIFVPEGLKWQCSLFSNYNAEDARFNFICIDSFCYEFCIPYNDDTKHLVGTSDEAPEYYRYWEE